MKGLIDVLEKGRKAANSRQFGKRVQSYLHSQIVSQFSALGRGAGTARGVSWAPFKNPWYTRKDGTQVPIWGGVPRADGKGKVKGRLRSKHQGGKKRYTPNSVLLQSTGILRGALLTDIRVSSAGIELMTPVKYAIWQDKARRFAFITGEEAQVIAGMLAGEMNR